MHPEIAIAVPPAVEVAAPRRRLAIGAGGLAVLLAAMDAYVVVSLFVTIFSDLRIPINHLERATPIITGYLLGYVAGMPLLARISDRYGRRIVIYVSLAGFAAGSALTASAHSVNLLVGGRALQGLAGGALLPVTMALAADLFDEAKRPIVLGGVGAAQELGSVLGPLYGVGLAALIGWRGIFWINIPLAVLAALAVHRAVPARSQQQAGDRPRVDVVGGLLIAISLALAIVALNNQHPESGVLPAWGPALLGAAGVLLVAFVVWEWRARTKLLDLTGVSHGVFFAALGASLCSGAALMVTLVFVQLSGQEVMDKSAAASTLLLARFLIALPIGAVLGGFAIQWIGARWVGFIGLLLAAVGYVLIAHWPLDVLASPYHLGPIHLPQLDTSLILTGLGLGLVIAPLSVSVLRVVPATSHGIASAALVVARMLGMLLGVAATVAWGLHRFQVLTANLPTPLQLPGMTDATYLKELATYENAVLGAYHTEYHSVFLVTAAVCGIGALMTLALGGRRAR
jgi:MFS transporter, DHA2 family, triacylglyceride efflux pump